MGNATDSLQPVLSGTLPSAIGKVSVASNHLTWHAQKLSVSCCVRTFFTLALAQGSDIPLVTLPIARVVARYAAFVATSFYGKGAGLNSFSFLGDFKNTFVSHPLCEQTPGGLA